MSTYDVIVVGAGNAALAAAVSASENGAKRGRRDREGAARDAGAATRIGAAGVPCVFAYDDPHEIGELLP